MSDIIEKLKQIQSLISDCISNYDGEESDEGEEISDDSSGETESFGGENAGDKIKLAATLLKKRMG